MKILVLLFVFTQFAYANCDQIINDNYCANLSWLQGPYIDAYSTAEVSISDLDGNAVDLKGITFYPWMIMDGHEHGSMDIIQTHKSKGLYLIEEIFFFSGMEGIWEFRAKYHNTEYTLFSID